MKIKCFLGLSLVVLSTTAILFGQVSVTIYDPVRTAPEKNFSAAEEKLIKVKAIPKARARWKEVSGCDGGNLNIIATASGAFTRKNSRQQALLYELCQTGNGFANNGLVIFEAGKIIAHFVTEGGWNLGIANLPDVNRNGFDELAIETSGGMHQGYYGGSVAMLEVSATAIKSLGWFLVYTNECESGGPDEFCDRSYKITAKPATVPVFYRQKYDDKGNDEKAKWVASGKRVVAKPNKDNSKYTRLKS